MTRLAIDFDGVLHAYSRGWQGPVAYDEPVPGAVEAVAELRQRGWEVVVFTAFPDLEEVRRWLRDNRFGDDLEVTDVKPPAEWYVDDRALRFTTWDEVLRTAELESPAHTRSFELARYTAPVADGNCVFCDIVHGSRKARILAEWTDAIAFTPLSPVTPGHALVVPRQHASSAVADPEVTALTARRAAEFARDRDEPCNVITSVGAEATQTIQHLHLHVVPRRAGDGLKLPWSST